MDDIKMAELSFLFFVGPYNGECTECWMLLRKAT